MWTGSSSRVGGRNPTPVRAENTNPIEFETRDGAVKLLVEMTFSGDFESTFTDALVVMQRSEVEKKWAGVLE